MKKVTQILAALVLSVGLVGVAGTSPASALEIDAEDCDNFVIFNTGPGSDNTIRCIDSINLEVTCVNNTYILTNNSQQALSGAATVTGNTSGAGAVSGPASNSNDTTVHTVGDPCVSTPTTPTTPETPAAPTVTPVATPVEKPAALPFTASNSVMETALIALIALATAAFTARAAVKVYRRATLK